MKHSFNFKHLSLEIEGKKDSPANTIGSYLNHLEKAYQEFAPTAWAEASAAWEGASEEDLEQLRAKFPHIPDELVELLRRIDGTFWRQYARAKVGLPLLSASGINFYLLSANEMLNLGADTFLDEYLRRTDEDVEVDDAITHQPETRCWLPIAYCTNNGGTSRLYLDFTPSDEGVVGQVVQYIHDPDKLLVCADNFAELLEDVVNEDFETLEDELSEDDDDEICETDHLETILSNTIWNFSARCYADEAEFAQEVAQCQGSHGIWQPEEIVLRQPSIVLIYEAWLTSMEQLLPNEELNEEDDFVPEMADEEGCLVEIQAELKADNGQYFTAAELLMKAHNQQANKELGDHIFFEGIDVELADDGQYVGFVVCGS